MTIPKIIWQTHETGNVPQPAVECIHSWKRSNPDWRYEFHDAIDRENFIRENFSAGEFEIFSRLPIGAMKCDFWRYAVLLKHGGVYADLDTICHVPIEKWPGQDSGLVTSVADTDGIHLCIWTLAAKPGHPVFRRALDLVVERVGNGIDTAYEHFVHHYTGPMLFTDAVRTFLGADEGDVPLDRWSFPDDDRREMNGRRLQEAHELWRDRDISIFPYTLFNGRAVEHLFANGRWRLQPGYESWMVARDRMNQEARRKLSPDAR